MSADAVKTCSKCGEAKQADMFRRGRRQCKSCDAAYQRTYYAENRAKIGARARIYRAANKEKIARREHQYRTANNDAVLERTRQWRHANMKKVREYSRRYYATNLERIREKKRKYRAANKSDIAKYNRHYRAKLPDAYVAQEIKRGTTLTRADIPPELSEAKRLQLKLKRLAREAMK